MRTHSFRDHSQWIFNAAGALRPPTIRDDTLFVGSRDNHLYAINTNTGDLRWQFEADQTVYAPAVTNKAVYAGSYDNSLVSVEKESGVLQWKTEVDSTVFAPVVDGGHIYTGSYGGQLYRFELTTGNIGWSFRGDGPMSVKTSPAVADGVVCAGSDDERLYVVTKSEGRQKWSLDMGGPVRALAQLNGLVCAGTTTGNIQAFDTNSGATAWLQQFEESIRTLRFRDESTVVGAAGNSVFMLDAADGSLRWEYDTNEAINSVVADHKFAYAATDGGTILAIDHRGEPCFAVEMPDPVNSLLVTTETLYATCEAGTLHSMPLNTFDEWSPARDINGDAPGLAGYSLTTDVYSPETTGYYIVLDLDADLHTYIAKLSQVDTAAETTVLIVDGNNKLLSTEQIIAEAEDTINGVTVKDRRREALEADLKRRSCTAASHSRKHIDGTKPLPGWLSGSHYFRHLIPPESHPQCPRLFVIGLQRYFGMKRTDGKRSWRLYEFAKESESGQETPHREHFIYGMSDLVSRRVLRATTSYDAMIPIPGHDGRISKPLDLTTEVINKTTPIDRRHILTRSNTTAQQKTLDDKEARYDNVEDSFDLDGNVDGQRVLVVDDICTSGASLSYAAKALFEAGATEVVGVVYGITVGRGRIREIDGPGATITDMQLVYGGESR